MKKSTHQHLGISYKALDNYRFDLYSSYCANIAKKTNVEFQKLFANAALSNYFITQLQELESEFKSFALRNPGISKKQMIQNYDIIVLEVHNHYPSALVEAANNLKIENQITLN